MFEQAASRERLPGAMNAWLAAQACLTSSIWTMTRRPRPGRRYPQEVVDGSNIFDLGYWSEDRFGASAWLVVRPAALDATGNPAGAGCPCCGSASLVTCGQGRRVALCVLGSDGRRVALVGGAHRSPGLVGPLVVPAGLLAVVVDHVLTATGRAHADPLRGLGRAAGDLLIADRLLVGGAGGGAVRTGTDVAELTFDALGPSLLRSGLGPRRAVVVGGHEPARLLLAPRIGVRASRRPTTRLPVQVGLRVPSLGGLCHELAPLPRHADALRSQDAPPTKRRK